jgi:hypothetical protein
MTSLFLGLIQTHYMTSLFLCFLAWYRHITWPLCFLAWYRHIYMTSLFLGLIDTLHDLSVSWLDTDTYTWPLCFLAWYRHITWPLCFLAWYRHFSKKYRSGSRGGTPGLKLEKIWFFWHKIVIFHTKYPKIFRASLRLAQFF